MQKYAKQEYGHTLFYTALVITKGTHNDWLKGKLVDVLVKTNNWLSENNLCEEKCKQNGAEIFFETQ